MPHASLPVLLQGGIALFAVAAAADLGHHLLPSAFTRPLEPLVGPEAMYAHVLLVIAMAVIMLGILQHGLRRRTSINPRCACD
jgi:hypothetical protein